LEEGNTKKTKNQKKEKTGSKDKKPENEAGGQFSSRSSTSGVEIRTLESKRLWLQSGPTSQDEKHLQSPKLRKKKQRRGITLKESVKGTGGNEEPL